MAVNIIWSLTNGGEAITDLVDHGNSSNGASTAQKDIFIRHDGDNVITNAGYYIRQLSTSYSGSATAAGDFAELLSWADAAVESDFGGFMIDQDANGGFGSTLPVFGDSKAAPTPGAEPAADVFRTGHGDSDSNLVALLIEAGLTGSPAADGEVQAGSAPGVSFRLQVKVPTSEDTLGLRQWDQVLKYDFTS